MSRFLPAALLAWLLLSLLPGPNLLFLPVNMLVAAPFVLLLRAARSVGGGGQDASSELIGRCAAPWLVPGAAILVYALVVAGRCALRRRGVGTTPAPATQSEACRTCGTALAPTD